jgi:hypothetical protein
MTGSNNRDAPGSPLDFDGFNVTARYWRLLITKNYGSPETSFHGIEFFGYDNRVFKMINKLNLPEYEDAFVENVSFSITLNNTPFKTVRVIN